MRKQAAAVRRGYQAAARGLMFGYPQVSQEHVWTLKSTPAAFPCGGSGDEAYSARQPHHAETVVIVTVVRCIVVAVGDAAVIWIVVPRPAAQHTGLCLSRSYSATGSRRKGNRISNFSRKRQVLPCCRCASQLRSERETVSKSISPRA